MNNTVPRGSAVCATCSQPLEPGYLRDLSSSKRYCGIACYPRQMMTTSFVGLAVAMDLYALAIAWPTLTVNVASALFDSAWGKDGV
ncbi:hypothetical protein [Bradyrhizobium sp. LA6.12]|uniref:hypothetical protein n=1 Tax=unclassified Bradyrhizobium TaxID=2631580 RepID=UPI003398EC05